MGLQQCVDEIYQTKDESVAAKDEAVDAKSLASQAATSAVAAVNFKGNWDDNTQYNIPSSVYYNGSFYTALVDNLGNEPTPTSTFWVQGYHDAEIDTRFNTVEATANAAAPQSTTYSKTEVDNKIVGLKNLIINGGFDVWQRGASFAYSAGTSGYHTADRVITSNTSDGQFTISKSEINGSNCVKFNVDTAVTDLTTSKYWDIFNYFFEGRTLYTIAKQGKTVTLSFVFNSNVTGAYPIAFRNLTNPDNVESYVSTFNYTTANVPQKVEVVIPLNHIFSGGLVNNSAVGFTLTIGFLNQGYYVTSTTDSWQTGNYLATPTCVNWGATAGNFIEIAELQLEEGSIATTFERRPYSLELSLCQRYYENHMNTNNQLFSYDAADYDRMLIKYNVKKRAIPTIVAIFSNTADVIKDISHSVDRATLDFFLAANSLDIGSYGRAATFKLYTYEIDAEIY